ncbi:ABC transporter substrate-binding protein [Hyphococcus formosus]|uniref:ABC transporter substrate-binding protein n=1 Tax=Hyphococcus formosus TaxID=3143534 RepID=UPI00398AF23D
MNKLLGCAVAGLSLLGNAMAADLDEIKSRGTLRVAVASLSPFVISDDEGNLRGFEIDSTTGLGEHLGVDIEYIEKPFCELADAVLEGEADIIASGYSNMAWRRRLLDFSLPYHDTEYFVVVAKKVAKRARTVRGLNRKDIKIAYQEGGVSGEVAKGEFPGADLTPFSSFTQIVEALEDGSVDGAVMFEPYLEVAKDIKSRKYVIPHEYALTRTIEAFAVDQNSEELRMALNEWVMAQDLEGYWDELEKTWFSSENMVVSAPPPYRCPSMIAVQ